MRESKRSGCSTRVLIGKPRLLVTDVPTTALDVTVQAQILELIKELHSAVISIMQDRGVGAETCDAALVMYGGQYVERGGLSMSFLCAGNALHLGTAPLHAENGPGHSDQAHADTRSAAVAHQRSDGLRLRHPVRVA